MDLNTTIIELNRVGKTVATRLSKLGLDTVHDLLFCFPFRYEDYTKVTLIDDLKAGEKVNICGQIELIDNKRARRRRMYITEALVSDESESIKVIWFNQPFIGKTLKVGDKVSLAGKVDEEYGIMTMVSPVYEKIGQGGIHTTGMVPIYHLTENITQKQLRFLIKQIIDLARNVEDSLPTAMKNNVGLMDSSEAILKIHFPKNIKEADEARKRLAFEELFLMQLKSQIIKKERIETKADVIEFKEKDTREFVESLPFTLTDDQKKASWQILKDLEKDRPMMRLLNGDVGSGKTIVAIIAMLNTALNNKQSVLMVPTEILARQHFNLISKMLGEFNNTIRVGLLTSNNRLINNKRSFVPSTSSGQTASAPQDDKNKKIGRKEMLKIIAGGEVDIIIGTHALVQKDVSFKNLSFSVIDEQHRFGVKQRKALMEKSGNKETLPHLLSMTATPIPRSLSLALLGDLDISMIQEKPLNRKPIMTKLVMENKRADAYGFIKKQIEEGRQAFVVCPLISESDLLGVKSVEEEFQKLNKKIFPNIPMASLHGKMKPKEKEKIMQDFLDKKYKILVSTSVVEVGVDIVNASIMMIEGAERFGLAQLHQFRGRVGRGEYQSYCLLNTSSLDERALTRLKILEKINDGFELAQMDLKMRGSGEIYGTTQKGFLGLKIATLFDYDLMNLAKGEAIKLIGNDPELDRNLGLKKIIEEWQSEAHLE